VWLSICSATRSFGAGGRAHQRERDRAVTADPDRHRTKLENALRGCLDPDEGVVDAARHQRNVAGIDGAEQGQHVDIRKRG